MINGKNPDPGDQLFTDPQYCSKSWWVGALPDFLVFDSMGHLVPFYSDITLPRKTDLFLVARFSTSPAQITGLDNWNNGFLLS
jgi:hypothetical protein